VSKQSLVKNRNYTHNPTPVGVLSVIAWLQQSSRSLRLFFCHRKRKKKTAGEDPQPFLSATTKILNRRLTALQVGRLKVLILRRAGAGFTA
jgi:hypothetical protein